MRFDEDTRGQSVLIGSILLFAILIVAFSSYQAFVVPSQNAEVEFNHNENVQSDMQDLRNSLLDVRSVERVGDEEYAIVSEHRPTRVRLGTRFPERLIALNPPAPSGTLRTVETSTPVEIQNADIDETKEERFPNDVSALFEPHETAFLTYQPSYNEYQSAPNTVLEHSLLYNDHPETDLIVREQNVVNTSRRTIDIVLFDGDYSRSSSRAITLDPQTLDGPTAPVPIVPDGGNIRLRLPVESREAWNESIDRTSEAEIIEAESSEEEIVIELEGDEYDLRISKVGFDGGTKDNQFTPIQTKEQQPGEGSATPPAYNISWDTTRMNGFSGFDCSGSTCKIGTGESESVAIETTDQIGGFAEFAVGDTNIGNFNEYASEFENSELLGNTDITFNATENLGETDAFVFSGDGRDRLTIEVTGFAVEIVETNSPVTEGETLEVTVEVTNTGAAQSTQDIELLDFGGVIVDTESVTLDGGDSTTVVLQWNTQECDAGTDEITVQSDDDQDTAEVTINPEDEPTPPFFIVTIDSTNSPVTEGETLTVDATITNTGEEEGTQDIELLDFDGTVVDTESVTLGGGDSTTVVLEWNTQEGDAGTDDITVQSEDHSDTTEVTVEEAEGENPPTVDNLDAQTQDHQNHARFNVQFEATAGDAGITDALLEMEDTDGNVVDTWSETYDELNSVEEDLTRALEENGGAGDDYTIRLIITDANNNQDTEEIERTG